MWGPGQRVPGPTLISACRRHIIHIGPVCDAPNARSALADDVPEFLRDAKPDEPWGEPWENLGNSCKVWVQPRSRDGMRTCFGSEYCLCVGAVQSHNFNGCKVCFEDLEAAYADLHAAEAGGAYLGCSICEYTCTCKWTQARPGCRCFKAVNAPWSCRSFGSKIGTPLTCGLLLCGHARRHV